MVIDQEFATIPLAKPSLHRYNLHEIISECYGEDWNGGHVQHWVKLTYLPNEGNILEVLVEKVVDLAGVGRIALLGITLVRQATKSKPCHETLKEEKNRCDNI